MEIWLLEVGKLILGGDTVERPGPRLSDVVAEVGEGRRNV